MPISTKRSALHPPSAPCHERSRRLRRWDCWLRWPAYPRAQIGIFGASAGAFYDDNLTRAQAAADKRAAGAVTGERRSLTNFVPFTGSDGVTFTLYGRGELFDRYNGLTNLVVGGTAAYRHKFGARLFGALGLARLRLTRSYDNYRDDLRTSARLDVRAESGKRFNEQFDASAGLFFERRYDNHGESVVPGISG